VRRILQLRWLAILLLLSFFPQAFAQFDRGLLWKIEKAGVAPSYVFGTYHTDDPRVTNLPEPVQVRFIQASSLSTEIELDPLQTQQAAMRLFFVDGQKLQNQLDSKLHRKTLDLLAKRNISISIAEKLKPWGAFTVLSTPASKSGAFLDQILYSRALAMTKPVFGLETIQEQMDVLDKMSMSDQVQLLQQAVDEYDQQDAKLEQLTDIYLHRDLAAMRVLNEQELPRDAALAARLMDRLIYSRNQKMAQRMQPRLQEGNAFIAIGALHLSGEKGVLDLLQKQGYHISVVY